MLGKWAVGTGLAGNDSKCRVPGKRRGWAAWVGETRGTIQELGSEGWGGRARRKKNAGKGVGGEG